VSRNRKQWHYPIDFDNVIFIVAKDNSLFELHSFLEHNDVLKKLAIKIIHAMLLFPHSAIQRKLKEKNFK
jgi:hypothetical protein